MSITTRFCLFAYKEIHMNFIEEFIKSSHIIIENVPKPYGAFHLIFSALSLIAIVAICYFARKNKDGTFRVVMLCVGLFLLLSEVYKQLYYLYAEGGEGYDWDIFPFQLCSVPMYLSVAVGLMKKNKVRGTICDYLVSIGFLGGIMAYIEPSGILKSTYFSLAHSCIWHALLIFMALYTLFTDNACRKIKDYGKSMLVLSGVVCTATALNVIFKSKNDFNMCYISPFYNTPLAVFSDFDKFFQASLGQSAGRIVSILIYILALILGGFVIYITSYFIKAAIGKRQKT